MPLFAEKTWPEVAEAAVYYAFVAFCLYLLYRWHRDA